jgi:hypothetical protein
MLRGRTPSRPVFWNPEIVEFSLHRFPYDKYAKNQLTLDQCSIDLRERKERARVHFIPNLKVRVFETLHAPDVVKQALQHS